MADKVNRFRLEARYGTTWIDGRTRNERRFRRTLDAPLEAVSEVLRGMDRVEQFGLQEFACEYLNFGLQEGLIRTVIDVVRKFDDGIYKDTPPFAEIALEWLNEKESGVGKKISVRTLGRYEKFLREEVFAVFGRVPIGQVDHLAIDRLVKEMRKANGSRSGFSRSNKQINNLLAAVRGPFEIAIRRHGIRDPFLRIAPIRNQKPDEQPFTPLEMCWIIATIDPHYKDYVVTKFLSGPRTGEIAFLKWEHVDFGRNEIYYCERQTEGEETGPKTDESERYFPMPSQLRLVLLKRRERLGVVNLGDFVFASPDGTEINSGDFASDVWGPLLEKLGFEYRKPYNTRHSYASIGRVAGVTVSELSRLMGTSEAMVKGTYVRRIGLSPVDVYRGGHEGYFGELEKWFCENHLANFSYASDS